jgi:hypothetical protein
MTDRFLVARELLRTIRNELLAGGELMKVLSRFRKILQGVRSRCERAAWLHYFVRSIVDFSHHAVVLSSFLSTGASFRDSLLYSLRYE